jgi:hypothetical protein
MVASTMAYSMSGWSETTSKAVWKISAFHPVPIALEDGVPRAEQRRQIAPRAAERWPFSVELRPIWLDLIQCKI